MFHNLFLLLSNPVRSAWGDATTLIQHSDSQRSSTSVVHNLICTSVYKCLLYCTLLQHLKTSNYLQKLVKYFKGFKNKGFNATDKIIKKAIYLMRYNPLCWK